MLKLEVLESNEAGIKFAIIGDPENERDQFHLFQIFSLQHGEVASVVCKGKMDESMSMSQIQPGNIHAVMINFPPITIKFLKPMTSEEREAQKRSEERQEEYERISKLTFLGMIKTTFSNIFSKKD